MQESRQWPAAAIFDMDAVLIDSNPFHLRKWADFLRLRGISFREAELPDMILGKRNDTLISHFFGPGVTPEQSRQMSETVEAMFREAFRPHVKPLPGLERFIQQLHAAGVPMAVASSAICKNIEFVVDALDYRKYFRHIVSGDEVMRPKPDPEIYLKAAAKLNVEPGRAVAFEDSPPGIEAVVRAGMKCVAIGSTFPMEKLRTTRAHLMARSFEDLSLVRLRALFNTFGNSPSPENG